MLGLVPLGCQGKVRGSCASYLMPWASKSSIIIAIQACPDCTVHPHLGELRGDDEEQVSGAVAQLGDANRQLSAVQGRGVLRERVAQGQKKSDRLPSFYTW